MNNILVSIRPKWCEKIFHEIGKDENSKPIYEKEIEVRKSRPKEVPFKCYIYCTKDRRNLLPIEHGEVLQKVNFWENTDAYYSFGNVIGEFICDKVYEWKNRLELDGELGLLNWRASYIIFANDLEKICLTYDDLWNYGNGKTLYGWHISDLKIYDKPKEIGEFRKPCNKNANCFYCKKAGFSGGRCIGNITRPPQSWCYVEEI